MKGTRMTVKIVAALFSILLVVAGVVAWQTDVFDDWFGPTGTPLSVLVEEGRAPVTFSIPQRGMTPSGIPPQFLARMTNHSDLHISIVEVTQLFRDQDRQLTAKHRVDTSFTPTYERRFAPDSEYEIRMAAQDADAASAGLLLREIVYDYQPDPERRPHVTIQRRWKNPAFEEALKRAMQD